MIDIHLINFDNYDYSMYPVMSLLQAAPFSLDLAQGRLSHTIPSWVAIFSSYFLRNMGKAFVFW